LDWFSATTSGDDFADKDVLEVGSFIVNGSVRPLVNVFGPRSYLGVDRVVGAGVDRVVDAEELTAQLDSNCADVLISTEMLEHCDDWRRCIREMVAALRPGGLLLITTRSEGFVYHCPPDRWRYTTAAILEIFDGRAGLSVEVCIKDTDPLSPGVFVRARKPLDWQGWLRIDLADVEGVTPIGDPWAAFPTANPWTAKP
jgi:SAM-dependent methyltransferase